MNRRRSLLAVRSFANEAHLLRILDSVADSPEVTGSASIAPTSTTDSQYTVTQLVTASPFASSKGSTSSTGIITGRTGSIVGAIGGAALIAGVVLCLVIRRRRARSALSAVLIDSQSDVGRAAIPYPLATEMLRLYVRVFLSQLATCGHTRLIKQLRSSGPFRPKYIPDTGIILDDRHDEL
jgi:hypothetical protein